MTSESKGTNGAPTRRSTGPLPRSPPGYNRRRGDGHRQDFHRRRRRYLNENGRAGVVMSSQASSAGRDEAKVRQKLVESGAVDVMIDIRGNFFYARTVPCQLWFFDRAKERDEARCDHVLMLDARNIYRKVSCAIFDFNPEQQKNIAAIVWLYRGQSERFLGLVEGYLAQAIVEGQATAGRPGKAVLVFDHSYLRISGTAREKVTDKLTRLRGLAESGLTGAAVIVRENPCVCYVLVAVDGGNLVRTKICQLRAGLHIPESHLVMLPRRQLFRLWLGLLLEFCTSPL